MGKGIIIGTTGGGVLFVELDILPAGGLTAPLVIPMLGAKVIAWELYVNGLAHYQVTDHAGAILVQNLSGDSDLAFRNNLSEYLVGVTSEKTFTITAMFVGAAPVGYFRMEYVPPV